MEYLLSERDGSLLVLTLARGKANALNRALVEELLSEVTAAAADDSVRGLVLASNRPRFFSSGFDVREVFTYDPPGMTEFFGRFIDLYESLYRFPKPLVGAVSGHCFAGGAILATACDFRIMAEGEYGYALNEVKLGLALPGTLRKMLVAAVGEARAREILLFGDPINPARALEIGLVRELAPEDQVRPRAIACARALADKPPVAFATIKRSLREIGGPDTATDRSTLDQFVGMWFSDEAKACRQAVVARM